MGNGNLKWGNKWVILPYLKWGNVQLFPKWKYVGCVSGEYRDRS